MSHDEAATFTSVKRIGRLGQFAMSYKSPRVRRQPPQQYVPNDVEHSPTRSTSHIRHLDMGKQALNRGGDFGCKSE